MLLSYFDLVEEFEYCIWFLYAQKKGIFFVRSLKFVLFSTIIFLILSKYWLGFYYIIFLQWFWIFHIYVNEIDFILNEDTNDNADFEYDDLSTDKDLVQLITPRLQIIWARSGVLMNKRYSIVQYMDMKILRYNENLQFVFINKYNFKILSFKIILNYIYNLKKLSKFNADLYLHNKETILYMKNNNQNKDIYLIKNKYLYFDYYFSYKKKIINYFFFTNFLIENFYFCFLDILKIIKNKNLLLKNHNLFIFYNSIASNYTFIEFGKNMILINRKYK